MPKIYKLKPSREVPNAGTMGSMIRVGMPLPQDMVNDICITTPNSYEFLALNRNVLRTALLDDPETTRKLLGIKVEDALAKKPEPEAEPKAEPKPAKKPVKGEGE